MAFGKQSCLAENIPAIPIISNIPSEYQITTNKIFSFFRVIQFLNQKLFRTVKIKNVAFERKVAKVKK